MKLIKILLIPSSILYGLIISIRNGLFNVKFFKSQTTPMSSIGIGNLSTGGTGKSVVVDYLISIYHLRFSIAVLSRGYGRKSVGFKIADSNSLPSEIGDEPFQFLKKHPKIKVVVSENRVSGVNKISKYNPEINLLILDDVMQHRWLTPSHLILTTTYLRPFFNDFVLPLGSLREFKRGKKRAQTIIITKCPSNLTLQNRVDFKNKISLLHNQEIFFTKIKYSEIVLSYNQKLDFESLGSSKITLVTGIADSQPLVEFLNFKNISFNHLKYRDHFNYNESDIKKIKNVAGSSIILTTEKDYGKIYPLLKSSKIFYLPISLDFFSFNEENEFDKRIKSFIKN